MVRLDDPVITAQVLEARLGNDKHLDLCPHSKLTPSALDYLRAHGVSVERRVASESALCAVPAAPASPLPPRKPSATGKREFKGILCPNIVILDEKDQINYKEMERYIEWLIQAGIHGLYPNGSTGEFVRLSWQERQDVVKLICQVNKGRVPILAGASEANLRDVLQMAEFYASIGVDAISLVPPYYYKMSNTSLFEYFAEIARQSPLDILLYNIPQFTQEIPLEMMEKLLPFERIMGTKDSSRDLPRLINTMHRLRAQRPDYVVLVGCEEILFPSVMMGASGGTIATSGIIPEVITEIYRKALAHDIEKGRELQYRILDLINLMLLGVNFPEGFKTGVAVRGFDVGPPRQVMSGEEQQYLLKLEAQISCVLGDMGYSIKAPRACPVTHLPPIIGR
ncbi:MAG: dihydrodipicolinate synthase family protein [Candidatus Latescibacteria bacterium]|nr:dihydrodipicolinate synthase family protein [Candidatus Latescibacterota bacterium]